MLGLKGQNTYLTLAYKKNFDLKCLVRTVNTLTKPSLIELPGIKGLMSTEYTPI